MGSAQSRSPPLQLSAIRGRCIDVLGGLGIVGIPCPEGALHVLTAGSNSKRQVTAAGSGVADAV